MGIAYEIRNVVGGAFFADFCARAAHDRALFYSSQKERQGKIYRWRGDRRYFAGHFIAAEHRYICARRV